MVEELQAENNFRETQHSDYHLNTLGGWHNDLGGDFGGYVKNPPKQYKIFKFGTFYSDIPESIAWTATQFQVDKKVFRPKLSVGDVLIFPVDIRHRGYPGKMSWRLARKFDQICSRFFKEGVVDFMSFLREKSAEDRRALFFTFGMDDEVLAEFELNNLKRADSQEKSFAKSAF